MKSGLLAILVALFAKFKIEGKTAENLFGKIYF